MSSKTPARPLSPFMLGPYYRFQPTSVLSFAHRLTGLGLSMGNPPPAGLPVWPGRRNQQARQQQRPHAEAKAGQAMGKGQNRSELEAVIRPQHEGR